MWGGASCQGRVSWCVQHAIGDSGRWGGTWNIQGALLGLFARQETPEFKEVVVYQCDVSREVCTLQAWLSVMITTGDVENRYNALNFDSLHAL